MNGIIQIWTDLGKPSLVSLITLVLSLCAIFGKVGKRLDNRIKKIYNDEITPRFSERLEKDRKDMLENLEKLRHDVNHRADSKIKSGLDIVHVELKSIQKQLEDLKDLVELIIKR